MYGFKGNVPDLSFLIGKEVNQIAIGEFDAQINLGTCNISIWASFRLKNAAAVEFEWSGHEPECAAKLVCLLGASITRVSTTEDALSLVFSNGCELQILDPDPQYESCSITEKGVGTIIV